jgi:hypothetical protein
VTEQRGLVAAETQRWKQLKIIVSPSPIGTDRVGIALLAISQVGRKQHVTTIWRGHADYNHDLGTMSECIRTVIDALHEVQARL